MKTKRVMYIDRNVRIYHHDIKHNGRGIDAIFVEARDKSPLTGEFFTDEYPINHPDTARLFLTSAIISGFKTYRGKEVFFISNCDCGYSDPCDDLFFALVMERAELRILTELEAANFIDVAILQTYNYRTLENYDNRKHVDSKKHMYRDALSKRYRRRGFCFDLIST